ncbi:hypothetical protein GCM10028803_00440 [Larkinella knui]|uniref:Carboxypeptidase regulatory-like domain-containing protein n=1 Tax=Larkinella knui TaxID=2025310 RepID=A0A3P1CJN9_9BACT|nr:carboxypeptidase-like regulatory domain-containing protein [Larkinella knui]RRB13448.1 carboxypeptidase regulatory-like domain-containing protein [Larkinella knui]
MPLTNLILFSVLVVRPNGQAFEGARIRVLDPANADITQSFLGQSTAVTDSFGKLVRLKAPNAVPAGTYTIEATAPGFQRTTVQTLGTFTGTGIFVLHPEQITDLSGYTIETPSADYLSPLAPVRVVVTAPEPDATQWQLIQTTISQGGREVIAESPVDPVTGEAIIPVRNRVQLLPRPNLVPDNQAMIIDPDFSDTVTLNFSAITDDGTYPTDLEPVELSFANIYPPGPVNDLSDYTNKNTLAKWITPFQEVTVFRGYYADVMIWLPVEVAGLEMWRMDFDRQNYWVNVYNPPVPDGLFSSGRVVRVRLRTPDIDGVAYSKLRFFNSAGDVSETLLIRYQ